MGGVQEVQGFPLIANLRSLLRCAQTLLLCAFVSGCATTAKPKVDRELATLVVAEEEVPESELLDVRIEVFDPGELPSSEADSRGLSEDIRTVEARYLPVQLKNAIQQTGHWGAVRVVPGKTSGAEVSLSGRILASDGEGNGDSGKHHNVANG